MEPCKFENEIIGFGKTIARMDANLENAIKETREHIEAGSKWRLAIVVACVGLVGGIVSGIVRFSVVEYKVAVLQNDQNKIQDQIFDMNYIKGKTEGIAEAAK
jgi:hypothetical protein